MADDDLRRLERDAATGGPEEQARLDAARARTEPPPSPLDARISELVAGGEVRAEDQRRIYTLPGGVEVVTTSGGYYRGESCEDTLELTTAGSAHVLRSRTYDTDHVNDESLHFDGAEVYRWYVSASDEDADPVRSPNAEAAAWANRLLHALGLPPGRAAFARLLSEVLRVPGNHSFEHVFDGLPAA